MLEDTSSSVVIRAMAVRRTSVWLWSIIVLQISFGAEAQLVLTLGMEPDTPLCPGEKLQFLCRHNTTHADPEWRVMNGTREVFRAIPIYFHGSPLEGHTLTNSTTELEVLQINPVQPSFNGLRYSCFYVTVFGEKKSNEVTVKLHEPPQVRNLTAQIVDSTKANISWQQDEDACNQTTTPLLYINNSDSVQSVEADCKQTQPHFECLIPGLLPDTRYILDIYITTEDGRRSTTADSVSFETGPRLAGPHMPPSSEGEGILCTTEPLACGLYGLSGLFFLALVVLVVAIVGILCITCLHQRNLKAKLKSQSTA